MPPVPLDEESGHSGSVESQGLRVTYQHLGMPLRQVPMFFWLLKPQGGNLQKKCVFPLESLVEMAANRDGWK